MNFHQFFQIDKINVSKVSLLLCLKRSLRFVGLPMVHEGHGQIFQFQSVYSYQSNSEMYNPIKSLVCPGGGLGAEAPPPQKKKKWKSPFSPLQGKILNMSQQVPSWESICGPHAPQTNLRINDLLLPFLSVFSAFYLVIENDDHGQHFKKSKCSKVYLILYPVM